MATEKQILANRANAKRSTGPKTAIGKIRSSTNAFQHGLSRSNLEDRGTLAKIEALANALSTPTDQARQYATTLARSQLEISRVRQVRAAVMTDVLAGSSDARTLWRLISLDRYEKAARAKGRRAKDLLTNRSSRPMDKNR